jgi:hypothetical protein
VRGKEVIIRKKNHMSTSEKFLRFASECERVADLARDPASMSAWREFAARWRRFAKSVESRSAKAHTDRMNKPHRRLPADFSDSGDATDADTELTGAT